MKNILVIYYSQTGQLRSILDSITSSFDGNGNYNLHFAEIKMAKPYPFPWSAVEFFDTFPETVQEIPQEIVQPEIDESVDYDLIFIGYQTWYMSPSIPVNSFIKSDLAARILKDKPVITVIGSRNMWLVGQEKMKRNLKTIGANLVGNIALIDKTPNLIGILTVIGWLIKGKKKNFLGFLPESGVSKKDITEASRFGEIIGSHLENGDISGIQEALVQSGAVEIDPKLLQLEKRANRLFNLWSKFMLAKGGPGDPGRRFRAKILLYLIPFGALILAPVSAIIAIVSAIVNRKKMKKVKKDFAGVEPVLSL